jgi:LCP family protein required for cell wall assembly
MMLDHLDDPELFAPPPDFRRDVERRGRELRARHRLTRAALAIAVVVALAGTGLLYVARRDAAIDRVNVATQPSTDGATNVLLVGEADEGSRADTIMILRFEPDGAIKQLSIPRDLWDEQTQGRINATYAGGIQSLIDAVTRDTGIPVDHVIQLGFAGFFEIVDELGGLRLAVDTAIRDRMTGLDVAASPCASLDGRAALSLVRARHLEYLDAAGSWRADPTGDLGRIQRAQVVLRLAIGALADSRPDPITIDRLTRVLADHATLDRGLTLARLAALGHSLAAAGASRTTSDELPVVASTTASGAAVLQLTPDAPRVLHRYGGPQPADASPTGPAPVQAVVPIRPC